VDLNKSSWALAVDIGGTKMDVAFINQDGELLEPAVRLMVPFRSDGSADAEKILDQLEPFVRRAKGELPNFFGVGLSVCGNIDEDTGEAVLVANLYWRYVPFGKMAADRFQVAVFSATDVRMALIAEMLWGAGVGFRHVAWMTLGTGYGGYLFLNGQIYGGTHGFAGNLGHSIYDEIHGDQCGCGQKGCFESYVAGPAIASQGQEAVDKGKSTTLETMQRELNSSVTTRMVFEAAARGDMAAQVILDGVIRKLGISLSSMVNLLDLDMIILGGGVWNGAPDFVQRVDQRIRGFLMTEEAKRDLKIVRESFDNSALMGAAANVFLKKGLLAF
jgi:glucokinase